MPPEIPRPWNEFLRDLDHAVSAPAEAVALGGFVMSVQYGMPRATGDIDLLFVSSDRVRDELLTAGGRGSPLHRKHRLYVDYVVLTVEPADCRNRAIEMFPDSLVSLRLLCLDPYDLALTKLDRNSPKDRSDFQYLAHAVPLDFSLLRDRFETDVASYVWEAPANKLRQTLDLWIGEAEEMRGGSPKA